MKSRALGAAKHPDVICALLRTQTARKTEWVGKLWNKCYSMQRRTAKGGLLASGTKLRV